MLRHPGSRSQRLTASSVKLHLCHHILFGYTLPRYTPRAVLLRAVLVGLRHSRNEWAHH